MEFARKSIPSVSNNGYCQSFVRLGLWGSGAVKNRVFLFAILGLLSVGDAFASSYFSAAKIQLSVPERDNNDVMAEIAGLLSGLEFVQGRGFSNGEERAVIEDEHSIRAYFLGFPDGRLRREQFEVTVNLSKRTRVVEIVFRELMAKEFSGVGTRCYQELLSQNHAELW